MWYIFMPRLHYLKYVNYMANILTCLSISHKNMGKASYMIEWQHINLLCVQWGSGDKHRISGLERDM